MLPNGVQLMALIQGQVYGVLFLPPNESIWRMIPGVPDENVVRQKIARILDFYPESQIYIIQYLPRFYNEQERAVFASHVQLMYKDGTLAEPLRSETFKGWIPSPF